ncbi:MAG: HD domain-containing phosphohydrolase, partial [Brevinematia bacterium]
MNEANVKTNGSNEIRVTITISKLLLKEGDILDQDILYYDNLKKGTILSNSLISAIQQIDSIDTIRVLRLKSLVEEEEKKRKIEKIEVFREKEEIETIEKISDANIKLGFTDEKTDKKIAEIIKNTIEKIRGKDYEKKVEETSKKLESNITDQIDSKTQRQETQNLIKEISESLVDTFSLQNITPIKSKHDVITLNLSNKSISNYFMDLVISDRLSFINSARSVILKSINSFGDDNGGIVLSSLLQFSNNEDYILSHSIFVMSISILIAKELTKLVYEKTVYNKEKLDYKFLKAISLKTFDMDDLINIGIACILHDIGLRKNFGVILPTFEFPKSSYSKIELHPSESSFFAQKVQLDVKIQRAIYEHHEYIDGSGYPKGITRYLSKYSPIIT